MDGQFFGHSNFGWTAIGYSVFGHPIFLVDQFWIFNFCLVDFFQFSNPPHLQFCIGSGSNSTGKLLWKFKCGIVTRSGGGREGGRRRRRRKEEEPTVPPCLFNGEEETLQFLVENQRHSFHHLFHSFNVILTNASTPRQCPRHCRLHCRYPIGSRRLNATPSRLPLLTGCRLDAAVNTAVNAGLPSAAVDCLFSPAADSMPPSMPSQCRAPIGGRRSNATPSRLPLLSGCGPDAAVHTESIARVDYVLIR